MSSTKENILIFPAGMPRSLEFLQKCIREGRSVIGASSLGYDASQAEYPNWLSLPYVTDLSFDDELISAITNNHISEIYTPNIVVWNHIDQIISKLPNGVRLVNPSPIDESLNVYRTAIEQAKHIVSNPIEMHFDSEPLVPLSEIEIAALCYHSNQIPGMCDNDKFRCLIEIMRATPKGDVVEIGSWWGKSAFILSRLASCYDIGNIICVDPWQNENLVQNESLVDSGSAAVDAREAFTVFRMNMLPYNSDQHINYLQLPSTEGAAYYRNNRHIESEEFGRTEYSGSIAILHIDGNHSYEAVKADVDSWGGLVVEKGWVIFDDYLWPYGDGPKRVGDAFVEKNASTIRTAFVMGGALFIQL